MREIVLRVIGVGAATVLLLGSCGGEDADTVPVADYASSVCGALETWVTDIQDRAGKITEGIDPGDAKAGKKRLQEFMNETVNGTERLISKVEDAGVPDTDGGEEAAEQIQSDLGEVKTILEGAEEDIADLPTNDPKGFGTGAQEIASSLQQATGEASSTIGSANSEELTEAFEKSEDCAAFGGGGA